MNRKELDEHLNRLSIKYNVNTSVKNLVNSKYLILSIVNNNVCTNITIPNLDRINPDYLESIISKSMHSKRVR